MAIVLSATARSLWIRHVLNNVAQKVELVLVQNRLFTIRVEEKKNGLAIILRS